MTPCLFASDLHGREARYGALFRAIAEHTPVAVLLGGDLLPGGGCGQEEFLAEALAPELRALRRRLGARYPSVLVILGNDDRRAVEPALEELVAERLLVHLHGRRVALGRFHVYGYACVPPTPFALKDWERYDVSRHVDPGCVSPEEGWRSVPVAAHETRYRTIEADLERLTGEDSMEHAVCLFHAPPHGTRLDRAEIDGRSVDHAPLDPHVGSIAVRRFIERRQPWITLHGHVHESARLTGAWSERMGRTYLFSAAHDGPELALVSIDLDRPEAARRNLL